MIEKNNMAAVDKLENHELRLRNIEKLIYAIHHVRIGGTTLTEEELHAQVFEKDEKRTKQV